MSIYDRTWWTDQPYVWYPLLSLTSIVCSAAASRVPGIIFKRNNVQDLIARKNVVSMMELDFFCAFPKPKFFTVHDGGRDGRQGETTKRWLGGILCLIVALALSNILAIGQRGYHRFDVVPVKRFKLRLNNVRDVGRHCEVGEPPSASSHSDHGNDHLFHLPLLPIGSYVRGQPTKLARPVQRIYSRNRDGEGEEHIILYAQDALNAVDRFCYAEEGLTVNGKSYSQGTLFSDILKDHENPDTNSKPLRQPNCVAWYSSLKNRIEYIVGVREGYYSVLCDLGEPVSKRNCDVDWVTLVFVNSAIGGPPIQFEGGSQFKTALGALCSPEIEVVPADSKNICDKDSCVSYPSNAQYVSMEKVIINEWVILFMLGGSIIIIAFGAHPEGVEDAGMTLFKEKYNLPCWYGGWQPWCEEEVRTGLSVNGEAGNVGIIREGKKVATFFRSGIKYIGDPPSPEAHVDRDEETSAVS